MRLNLRPSERAPAGVFARFALQEKFAPGAYELDVRAPDNRFVLLDAHGAALDSGVIGDSVGRRQGFLWAPDAAAFRNASSFKFAVTTAREAAVELRGRMSTTTSRESSMLRIVLTGRDPELTAAKFIPS